MRILIGRATGALLLTAAVAGSLELPRVFESSQAPLPGVAAPATTVPHSVFAPASLFRRPVVKVSGKLAVVLPLSRAAVQAFPRIAPTPALALPHGAVATPEPLTPAAPTPAPTPAPAAPTPAPAAPAPAPAPSPTPASLPTPAAPTPAAEPAPLPVADPVPAAPVKQKDDGNGNDKDNGNGNGKAKGHDKNDKKDGKHDGDVVVSATIAASPSADSPDAPAQSVSP